ncbi:MAG: flagellar hook protein FlgE, partial [Candidatus Muiribacteriaceae bacterium]
SGLQSHQVKMDVISDNIANVNTAGFKKSRVMFSNIFSQTIGFPSAPTETRGGVNSKQVGLGVQVSAIDKLMGQGAFETTGNVADCGISGNGFFMVNDGEKNTYTRAGNFLIDSNGDLVHGNNGGRVQGWPSEWDDDLGSFVLKEDGVLTDLNFLALEKLSAKPTSKMVYSSNLMAATDDRKFPEERTLVYGTAPNEEELRIKFQKTNELLWEFRITDDNGNYVSMPNGSGGNDYKGQIHMYKDGRIKSVEVGGNYDTYSFSANGVVGGMDNFTITMTDSVPPAINYWTFRDVNDVEQKVYINMEKASISTATASVYRFRMYDEDGNLLDMTNDGNIDEMEDFGTMSIFNATGKIVGFDADPNGITGDSSSFMWDGMNIDLSLSDDLRQMQLTERSTGESRDIEVGSPGIDFSVNGTNKKTSFDVIPGTFHSTSLVVYDSQGTPHTVTTNFEKLDENKWRYHMSLDKDDPIVKDYLEKFPAANSGDPELSQDELDAIMKNVFWDSELGYTGEGVLKFNSIGRLDEDATRQENGAEYPNIVNPVSFTPPGAEQVDIELDVNKITQYDSETFTTAARSQNGYAMGMLQGYTIDQEGVIVGSYSNDQKWTIGKLGVATFQNPAGLEVMNGTMYTTTANSGEAVIRKAGEGGAGTIQSGKLEMSNVDLSRAFTDMIIAQRGFQANSKAITTSDQLLQELINLKR